MATKCSVNGDPVPPMRDKRHNIVRYGVLLIKNGPFSYAQEKRNGASRMQDLRVEGDIGGNLGLWCGRDVLSANACHPSLCHYGLDLLL